jgi:hypothetical protein
MGASAGSSLAVGALDGRQLYSMHGLTHAALVAVGERAMVRRRALCCGTIGTG